MYPVGGGWLGLERLGMLGQEPQGLGHRALKLGIVPRDLSGRILFHFDVWSDTPAFDVPLAVGVVEPGARGADEPPSIRSGSPPHPTRPPQVRVPISGPIPSWRNM